MTTPAPNTPPSSNELAAHITAADLDTITRPVMRVDADHVAVPATQWNATVFALSMVAETAIDPAARLGWDNGVAQFKPADVNGHPTIGTGLNATLDQWRTAPDAAELSAAERERRLYVQACAWTLTTMGATARSQTVATPAPSTGWFQLAVAAAVGVVIVSVSLTAYAWYRAQVDTESVRVKAAEHQHAVDVANGGQLYQARVAEFVRSGRMPPPSETELAVRASVEAAAAAHRAAAADGYIASALRDLAGAAGDGVRRVTDSAASGAAWAAGGLLLWLLLKGR